MEPRYKSEIIKVQTTWGAIKIEATKTCYINVELSDKDIVNLMEDTKKEVKEIFRKAKKYDELVAKLKEALATRWEDWYGLGCSMDSNSYSLG